MTTAQNHTRKRLLSFIDTKAFDSVLGLPEETYTGKDRETFIVVKRNARSQKRSFHKLKTAGEVKENFLRSVRPAPAQRQEARLEYFQIFNLHQLESEFNELCNELKV